MENPIFMVWNVRLVFFGYPCLMVLLRCVYGRLHVNLGKIASMILKHLDATPFTR